MNTIARVLMTWGAVGAVTCFWLSLLVDRPFILLGLGFFDLTVFFAGVLIHPGDDT